jgi:hypothetical protein
MVRSKIFLSRFVVSNRHPSREKSTYQIRNMHDFFAADNASAEPFGGGTEMMTAIDSRRGDPSGVQRAPIWAIGAAAESAQ